MLNKERKEKPKGQSKDIIQTQETTEQQKDTKYIKYKQTRARRTLDRMRVNPGAPEE